MAKSLRMIFLENFRRVRSLRGVWRAHYTPKLKKRTALLRKLKDVFRRHVPAGGDRVHQLTALDRLGVASTLQNELAVVDAAGDVGRKHDRCVDGERRVVRTTHSHRRAEPQGGGDAKATFTPAAHRILAAPGSRA
jgi:hypothetical protein